MPSFLQSSWAAPGKRRRKGYDLLLSEKVKVDVILSGRGRRVRDRELIFASLEDGTSIQIEACVATREQDVALGKFAFSDVSKAIGGIAQALATATEKARPTETEIEFGLDIGVETGHLLGVLVSGSGNANLKVKLTWRSSGSKSASQDVTGP